MGSKGWRKEKKRVQVPLERVRGTTPKQDTPSLRVFEVLTSHLTHAYIPYIPSCFLNTPSKRLASVCQLSISFWHF